MRAARRIQLQLPLPYHREPRQDERVRGYLEGGFRIVSTQRLSDGEVLLTLEESGTAAGS